MKKKIFLLFCASRLLSSCYKEVGVNNIVNNNFAGLWVTAVINDSVPSVARSFELGFNPDVDAAHGSARMVTGKIHSYFETIGTYKLMDQGRRLVIDLHSEETFGSQPGSLITRHRFDGIISNLDKKQFSFAGEWTTTSILYVPAKPIIPAINSTDLKTRNTVILFYRE